MPYFGLYDWLSDPSPSSKCQCNKNAKKSLLCVITFIFLMALGFAQYIFIEKFYILLPPIVHAVLFLLELITFLIFLHSVFAEKGCLAVPFAVTQLIRSIGLVGLIIYYFVQMFTREINKPDIQIPSLQYDDYHHTDAFLFRLIGHLVFCFFGHLFLLYVAYAISRLETAIRSKIRSIGADKIEEIKFVFGRSVDGFYVRIELFAKKEPEPKLKR